MQNNYYLLLFFSFCAISPLVIAYILQYGFNLSPCKLCMYERMPFFIISVIPLIFLSKWLHPYIHSGLIAIAVLLAIDLGISFYHIGVENHWFKPALCKLFQINTKKTGELTEELKDFFLGDEATLSECDRVQFKFLGLSLTVWNFIYCLGLFCVALFFLLYKIPK